MDDNTQFLPIQDDGIRFAAPENVRASAYENMLTPPPSFTPINSDVNSAAGTPGYAGAPAHYKGANGIQPFDVWDAYDMDRYRASAWKYFARYNFKGSAKNDLEKCSHYIQEAIDRLDWSKQRILNRSDIHLTPAVVIPAFGIVGIMYDAALDFLLSFTTEHPKTYLIASKAQVDSYLTTF